MTSQFLCPHFYSIHSREYDENINRLRNRVKLNVGLQSDYFETDSDFNETLHTSHIRVTQHLYKAKMTKLPLTTKKSLKTTHFVKLFQSDPKLSLSVSNEIRRGTTLRVKRPRIQVKMTKIPSHSSPHTIQPRELKFFQILLRCIINSTLTTKHSLEVLN